jgi:hypothetical protein
MQLLSEFLNEYSHSEKDKDGYKVSKWTKTGDNDWRDTWRYCWALAMKYTNNGAGWKLIYRVPTLITTAADPDPPGL